MHPLLRLGLLVLAVLLLAAVAVGAIVGFDPPTQHIEQVVPNERFAR